MKRTEKEIRDAIELFLENWDRHDWMQSWGEWVSDEWVGEREAYDDAVTALREAVAALPDATSVRELAKDDLLALTQAVIDMADDLDGQVTPDESDYIAPGLLDPDEVSTEAVDLDVLSAWDGWDCREGWAAYRVGRALYVNWWRNASGNRHSRDLWVGVDDEFFADEGEDDEE